MPGPKNWNFSFQPVMFSGLVLGKASVISPQQRKQFYWKHSLPHVFSMQPYHTLSRIFLKLCNFRLPEFSPNCPWPDPQPFRKLNRPAHTGVLFQTEASLHTIGNPQTYNEESDRSKIYTSILFSHLAWPVPTCHWSQRTSFSQGFLDLFHFPLQCIFKGLSLSDRPNGGKARHKWILSSKTSLKAATLDFR